MRIVPVYAALLALLFLLLSVRVIVARRAKRVSLGTGGNPGLERRVRVLANFAEYTPFAVLLLAMAAVREAPAFLLRGLGLLLLAPHAAHALGVSRAPEDFRFRVAGTGATLKIIGTSAFVLVV